MSRLNLWYKHILKKDNIYKLQSSSIFENPCLHKVIVNVNVKDTINDSKNILPAITALELTTYQKPKLYYSRKSIAAFKLKKNTIVGCKVTLQKEHLFNWLELFVFIVLPRINDFKGFTNSKQIFENDINIGIEDLTIFPQINANLRHFTKKLGCNISFLVKTKNSLIKNLMLNEFQIPKEKFN